MDIGIGVYNGLGFNSECHFGVTVGPQNVVWHQSEVEGPKSNVQRP